MKIFGIFFLNFLWFRKTSITIVLPIIPTHAIVLWIIIILSGVMSPSVTDEMFPVYVQLIICSVVLLNPDPID